MKVSEELNFEQIYNDAEEAMKDNPPTRLFQRAINGGIIACSYAEILLSKAMAEFGPEAKVGYPDTAYFLPVIRSLSGEEITELGQLPPILNRMRAQINENDVSFNMARLAGESTAYAAEIIETVNYLRYGHQHVAPYTGFIEDPIMRKYGILMVDWTIPGEAVIVGKARSSEDAGNITRELMSKGMMCFFCNEVCEQVYEAKVKVGKEYFQFPLGNFTQVIHVVNYALRAGIAFAGIEPGLREQHREYQRKRIMAFVLHLGEIDDVQVAAHFAAIFLGFPVICDTELPEDHQIPGWYESHPDYDTMVSYAMELRGIKIKILDIPVPIAIGPSFEGETIRRADMHAELGGPKASGFEIVRSVGADDIEDGRITVEGPDLDEIEVGGMLPVGIWVKVYGKKMQDDFEGVLERRLHDFINFGEGLFHMGQRDINWIRVSNEAFEKGFRVKHFGEIILAKMKNEFPAIVDRVEVGLYTDQAKVDELAAQAKEVYTTRDQRLAELSDESVDTFYSCILCQSFAPAQVCVVTPDRTGLCGAVSWLDGRAAYEIDVNGPCRPIDVSADPTDPEKGQWQSVNEYVYENSQRKTEVLNLYSIMEYPMTSCGCFEAIAAIVPEANGVMVTTRDHGGDTPCGMNFSTLAGSVGGGMQTPGFMGHSKQYILSDKFVKAEGGLGRLVWIPKSLKEQLGEDLVKAAEKQGLGADFVDKIADETVGSSAEEILGFLEEKGHPALTMESMF